MPGGSYARKPQTREDTRRAIKVSRECARLWDVIAAAEETGRDAALERHAKLILSELRAAGKLR